MLSETLCKYLAGLFDADGCVSFDFTRIPNEPGRYNVGLKFMISSSREKDTQGFVRKLPELTGMGSIQDHKQGRYYDWLVMSKADIHKLLPRLMKHMVVKGTHCEWIYHVWCGFKSRSIGDRSVSTEQRATLSAASKESRSGNNGPLKPKNHPSWAWLAGYLDGDGCYYFKAEEYGKARMWVTAAAHEKDIHVLEFLHKAFSGYIYNHGKSPSVKYWRRNLGCDERDFALRFLRKLVPHAKLKRHKIETIIAFHRHRQQRLNTRTPEGEAIVWPYV